MFKNSYPKIRIAILHKGYFIMVSLITHNLIWTEGIVIVIVLLLTFMLGWFFFQPLAWISLLFFVFSFYFFRNPERYCFAPLDDSYAIISPADGKIVDISYSPEGSFSGFEQKISIFLSPFDVHVNWIPLAGKIEAINYKAGKFMFAFLPKSSELNEHNDVLIRHSTGHLIGIRQIAGTVARRIRCWIKPGEHVQSCQKYGMIKFSSRVDLFLPKEALIEVNIGQKVYGGQTVIGRLL